MIVVQLCNKTGRVGTNVSERVAKKGESENMTLNAMMKMNQRLSVSLNMWILLDAHGKL